MKSIIKILACSTIAIILSFCSCCAPKEENSLSEEKEVFFEKWNPMGENYLFNSPVTKTEPCSQPEFSIDPNIPWIIMFGRGSGMTGLNTVSINERGLVTIYWRGDNKINESEIWNTGTTTFTTDDVKVILHSVKDLRIMGLKSIYSAGVHDGSQWLLSIQQGERQKVVYFDNHFPKSIIAFGKVIDDLLIRHKIQDISWTKVPQSQLRNHQKPLWNALSKEHLIPSCNLKASNNPRKTCKGLD